MTDRSAAEAHDRQLFTLLAEATEIRTKLADARFQLLRAFSEAHVSGIDQTTTIGEGADRRHGHVTDLLPEGSLFWMSKGWGRGEGNKTYVIDGGWTNRDGVFIPSYRPATLDDVDLSTADEYQQRQVDKVEALQAALADKMAEVDAHEESYTGWDRYFLVTSSAGHVHRGMSCSTCKPTTTYAPVFTLSAASEAEAIAEMGETLCSVCYPNAPVEGKVGKITKAAAAKLIKALNE